MVRDEHPFGDVNPICNVRDRDTGIDPFCHQGLHPVSNAVLEATQEVRPDGPVALKVKGNTPTSWGHYTIRNLYVINR